ncbi:hypothetical protein BU17DRAFT_52119 [Hysterangium stoloniferum]|nr:hypothetical protein BU17DRAFT_52119 [Hysterangium stoloniferum]
MRCNYNRTATLVLAIGGTLLNASAVLELLALWRTLKWESESEWEGSENYTVGGLRVVWCLLTAYFTLAALACIVGIIGVVKRISSYVRLYRDCSLADLVFCALFTTLFGFTSFRPGVPSAVCEELSRQPDLMRDLAESGLSVETCEAWFEKAVIVLVVIMAVSLVLQFILTISTYLTNLIRATPPTPLRLDIVGPHSASQSAPSPHHIFLLPDQSHCQSQKDVIIYAPVALSPQDARELDATEAWVSERTRGGPGRIRLAIKPGEGLMGDKEA